MTTTTEIQDDYYTLLCTKIMSGKREGYIGQIIVNLENDVKSLQKKVEDLERDKEQMLEGFKQTDPEKFKEWYKNWPWGDEYEESSDEETD